jgi:N utilization substance protein A
MATKKRKKSEALKATDIVAALGAVTKEKSISINVVLDSLKDAIISAAKKYLSNPINVEVSVDREKGTIEAYTLQYVVDEVEDPETQIHIDEAKKIDDELEVGDELVEELDINEFGRSAIQTAKQIIMQRIREFERQKVFDDYSERIGELITGTVQQIDKGNILINLGRTEAMLPFKEQIRRERFRQGDTIRGCIIDVVDNQKGPQVIISRTSPAFLERLFEIEVPEIFENIVRIIKIVRSPGFRAKVAVTTNDSRVDPVGACVGMRGNRVQAIVRELSNERMDIINWTDEINLLVRRVFSPTEVKRVIPVGDKKVVVIVNEEDLAQAIGREGQHIRLASKFLDKEIDIYGDEEFEEFTDEQREEILTEQPEDEEVPEDIDGAEEGQEAPENEELEEDEEAEERKEDKDEAEAVAAKEDEAETAEIAEDEEAENVETGDTDTESESDVNSEEAGSLEKNKIVENVDEDKLSSEIINEQDIDKNEVETMETLTDEKPAEDSEKSDSDQEDNTSEVK